MPVTGAEQDILAVLWSLAKSSGYAGVGGGAVYLLFKKWIKEQKTADESNAAAAQAAAKMAAEAKKKAQTLEQDLESCKKNCSSNRALCSEHLKMTDSGYERIEASMAKGFEEIKGMIMAQRIEYQEGLARAHERIDRIASGNGGGR